MFIDQKEPIQVEKASNNSFLKTFNLTKRTLMYHCEGVAGGRDYAYHISAYMNVNYV